ncbi:MAG: HEAT repeat domain-containing protein [Deltaproteobacteria bacterium]|nr:HEAT repeat domain-containing protein [Deltaproteobacteria bacterium]
MSQTPEEIVIVNPSVDLQGLEDLCLDLDLDHLETFEPPAAAFYEQVHESEDGEVLVRILHDHFVEIWLIAIQAEDEERVRNLQRAVFDEIGGFSLADLAVVLDRQQGPERKFALRGMVAANAGTFDAGLFDRVVAALADGDADLRYTAIICAARLGWSRFSEALRALIDKESDDEVKQRAVSTLDAIEAVHGG